MSSSNNLMKCGSRLSDTTVRIPSTTSEHIWNFNIHDSSVFKVFRHNIKINLDRKYVVLCKLQYKGGYKWKWLVHVKKSKCWELRLHILSCSKLVPFLFTVPSKTNHRPFWKSSGTQFYPRKSDRLNKNFKKYTLPPPLYIFMRLCQLSKNIIPRISMV